MKEGSARGSFLEPTFYISLRLFLPGSCPFHSLFRLVSSLLSETCKRIGFRQKYTRIYIIYIYVYPRLGVIMDPRSGGDTGVGRWVKNQRAPLEPINGFWVVTTAADPESGSTDPPDHGYRGYIDKGRPATTAYTPRHQRWRARGWWL